MRYAIYLPAFNEFADLRTLAQLAREAEDAGWDGFFLWDHVLYDPGMLIADPWVALSAIAMTTERIQIGALVTPLARRRPWMLARTITSLDRLARGRVVVGVGIGNDSWHREYSAFGEPIDAKQHAAMLDEGLAVMTGLWRGVPFSHAGTHYTVADAEFLPTPVQQPHPPIWVAGMGDANKSYSEVVTFIISYCTIDL